MTAMEWVLWVTLSAFYIFCLFTVCALTFRKGWVGLGILGIFLPFLWLVGAVLPARPGSRHDLETRGLPPVPA